VAQAVPQLAPAIVELMKFGIQAFKESRSVEGVLTQTIEQLQESGAPNPQDAMQQQAEAAAQAEQAKVQAQMQAEQAKLQMDQAKMQAQMQLEQAKMQQEMALEQQRQQFQQQLETQKMQQEAELARFKANLDAQTKLMVARISANPGMDIPNIEQQANQTAQMAQAVGGDLQRVMAALAAMQQQQTRQHGETLAALQSAMAAMYAPKRIIRGPDGRAAGVEIVREQLN
jgi:hypothetical protein